MKMRTNLSQVSCNKTFRGILRSDSENTKDQLIAPVKEVNKAKFALRKETRSLDNLDQFQSQSEKEKLKRKYEKLYCNENAAYRVTINLPEPVKRNVSARKDQVESFKTAKEPVVVPKKSERFMKDFYQTNPIQTVSKKALMQEAASQQNKNPAKSGRVAEILGSSGVKSIFNSDNSLNRNKQFSDKITNRTNILSHSVSKEEKTFEYKRFNHYFDGKKGGFM